MVKEYAAFLGSIQADPHGLRKKGPPAKRKPSRGVDLGFQSSDSGF